MLAGFFPGAPVGDVTASSLAAGLTSVGGSGPGVPTNITINPLPLVMAGNQLSIAASTQVKLNPFPLLLQGNQLSVGEATTIIIGPGDLLLEGQRLTILTPTDIFLNPKTLLMAGGTLDFNVPATEGVECAPSFIGTTDLIPLYDVADIVEAVATFTDTDTGDLVDPVNVQLRIRDPLSVIVTVTPLRLSRGVYRYDISAALSGTYRLTWMGANVSEEAQFSVTSSLSDAT